MLILKVFQHQKIMENKSDPDESYANKYHFGCSFDCKLVCADDQSTETFKSI